MANGHFRPFSNGASGLLRPVMSPGLHIKSRVNVYGSIIADVLTYRFAKVTIYLGIAFIVTIFDIFS